MSQGEILRNINKKMLLKLPCDFTFQRVQQFILKQNIKPDLNKETKNLSSNL